MIDKIKEKDIDYILEKELSPDRYCYIHNYIIDLKREKEDYKSRCEKATEYIKTKKAIINTDYIRIFDLFKIDEQGYIDILLNILQGGKNEQ